MNAFIDYFLWIARVPGFFWEIPAQLHDRLSLLRITEQKYCEGYTTMELMARAKTEAEKRRVALVALLEIDEPTRYQGMSKIEMDLARKSHLLARAFIAAGNPHSKVLTRGANVSCRN